MTVLLLLRSSEKLWSLNQLRVMLVRYDGTFCTGASPTALFVKPLLSPRARMTVVLWVLLASQQSWWNSWHCFHCTANSQTELSLHCVSIFSLPKPMFSLLCWARSLWVFVITLHGSSREGHRWPHRSDWFSGTALLCLSGSDCIFTLT